MNCDIARDLLPLYADGLCSEESRKAMEEHLKNCRECRELLAQVQETAKTAPVDAEAPAAEAAVLRGISQEWRRQRRRSRRQGVALGLAFLTPMLVLMLLLGEFGFGYDYDKGQDFYCGYKRALGTAFVSTYYWDGSEEGLDITLPESVFGYRVKSLGMYTGRGGGYAFQLAIPATVGHAWESFGEDLWESSVENYPRARIVELPFTLRVGKNLKHVNIADFNNLYGLDDEGRETLWHVTLSVDCDPANKTFYSENGVLYDRKTGEAVLGTAGGTP